MAESSVSQINLSVSSGAGPSKQAIKIFLQNKGAVLGLFFLFLIVVTAILGPLFIEEEPFSIVGAPFMAPMEDGFIFGTDYVGRDIFKEIIHGSKATLGVALAATFFNLVIGLTVGALSGYYKGVLNTFLLKFTEFFQVLPPLLFSMVIVSLFNPSVAIISFAIGVVTWPPLARLTRAEFLRIREMEYVEAAKLMNAGNWRIITKIILPNALPPIIVNVTLNVGSAVLYEAGLSFLGLGDPNVMSWGLLIGSSRDYIFDAWWAVTFPGVIIFITSLSICLVGDGLTMALNPKLRKL